MKSIQEFLLYLSDLDIRIWSDGTRLRCNAPQQTLTPALHAELTERKAEILAFINNANSTSSSTLEPIRPVRRDGNIPLSFAQQGLWFLDQLEGGSAAYNQLFAVHLKGSLDLAVLKQALTEIVQRHEVLRTTFKNVDGQPVQVIAPAPNFPVSVVDWGHLLETKQWEEVRQLAISESQCPFNLAQGPLLRVALLQLGSLEHVLLFTIHHMVSDAWSSGIILQELAALYEVFSQQKLSSLPEQSIQYADFAYWQRQWLRRTGFEEQLTYWKQQLGGAFPILELPSDRPRPTVQAFRGATTTLNLGADLSQRLNILSQQERATLFMTLLASFQALLYRYTDQEDICVGTTVANRHHRDLEPLIGFFINTLVMRTALSGKLSFQELLGRVRQVALEAYNHQDLPFDLLVAQLQPERNRSYNPLFQVMFVLENAPINVLEQSGLNFSLLEMPVATAKFDLTLSMRPTEQGLLAKFEYNTDLFDAATINRMAGHFQTLLNAIAANPQQRLCELPLLSEAERHYLLGEWNETQVDYPKDKCIHQLVEAQVEQTPDAVAVVFADQQLTYRELNHRANQLAHYLRSLGVGPEVLVGICMERSIEMVLGLLSILKAGGAYVPLDPAYPQERLAFMLQDAAVPVLLTQQQLVETLPAHQAQVICLDDWEAIPQTSQSNPTSSVNTDNLAYAIYTSGSTGRPKGVLNSHSGVCNRLLWMQDTYQLTAKDRVLQKTPFSFDVSVWEFFWPLLKGATLVVAQPGGHQDSDYLVKLIAREQITTIHFVPSMLQVFLEEPGLAGCNSLKRVICSGEVLPLELQKRCLARLDAELHNLYGPTEAAIDVTFWQCQRQSNLAIVPIGRPIANTQLYILDFSGQPVPVGVPGELHIGGDGLARGYLNRPELTAEKFIPNPFSDKPGTRLYKTGDQARYLPSGNIEFLGRLDHQVKIRGFRIELGEIEAVLGKHPQVRTTVVLVWEDKPGSKRLVAYVVPNNQTPTTSELRSFLKTQLPDYMLPSTFVMLEALPLTPNGKVNRKALPAPDTGRPELDKAFVAPRTPVEAKLANIWCEFLGVEQVGIHDNFFELGGDSILSVQIIHKANQADLQLTPKQLFDNQTIAELAAVAGTLRTQAEQGLEIGQVPLTPIQQWFFAQNQLDPQHSNQAFLLETTSLLDPTLLKQVLRQLLVHHDALRLRFIQAEFGWQQTTASPDDAKVPVTLLDLSALPEVEQKSAIEAAAELHFSLNLSEGLLVRVAIFNLGANKPSRLLLVIHHLIVDDVSWQILLEDFQTLYEQLSRGEAIYLPPKTTSFKQWANRVSEYAHSVAFQQELDYWLAEAQRQVTQLPMDFSGGDNTKNSTGTISVSLCPTETQTLLQEVTSATKTQIDEVLLTALVQAFEKWTGSKKLLVDLKSSGREEIFDDLDLSRTVGCFTTLFPALLNLGKASNSGEALKAVKEQLRHIPNRGVGYGVIKYLSKERAIKSKLQALPQAEVSFNYLGQSDQLLLKSPLFKRVQEFNHIGQSLYSDRSYLLEVNVILAGSQLRVDWTYCEAVHRRATVESLAEDFIKALRRLIDDCQSPKAKSYTPSDFPQAQLNQKDLDKLLTKLNPGS